MFCVRGRGPIEHICGASAATLMVNQTCVRVFLVKDSLKFVWQVVFFGMMRGIEDVFLHSSYDKLEMGERGGLVKEKLYLRSQVGYGVRYTSTKVEKVEVQKRLRRPFTVSTKIPTYRLWYYHASNGPGGLSSGEKVEEEKKKKGRFFHMSLDHGRRSGRSTWSVPVRVQVRTGVQ